MHLIFPDIAQASLGGQVLRLFGLMFGLFFAIVAAISLLRLAQGKEIKSLWVKFGAWLLIIPPLLIPLLLHKILFIVIFYVLSQLCFREYARSTGLSSSKSFMIVSIAAITLIYLPILIRNKGMFETVAMWAMLMVMALPVALDRFQDMTQKSCLAVLGVLYFGWMLSHTAWSIHGQYGVQHILFLMFIVSANDAFAYIWGSLIGKHLLAPNVSPHKTVEGALGAMASVIFLGWFLRFLVPEVTLIKLILLCTLLSICGVLGDLVISYIKRDMNIKDMGAVIPGHGGLLDRFDSLIFAAPVFYHFIGYFYGHGLGL